MMMIVALSGLDALKLILGVVNGTMAFLILAIVLIHSRMTFRGYVGSLPWQHVIMAGAFSLLASLYVSFDVISRLGKPLSWHMFISMAIVLTGMPAMLMVMSYIKSRQKEVGL